jgi:hypothetical protein
MKWYIWRLNTDKCTPNGGFFHLQPSAQTFSISVHMGKKLSVDPLMRVCPFDC